MGFYMRTLAITFILLCPCFAIADNVSAIIAGNLCSEASNKSTKTVTAMTAALDDCHNYPNRHYREKLIQQFLLMKIDNDNDNDNAKAKCVKARDIQNKTSEYMSSKVFCWQI